MVAAAAGGEHLLCLKSPVILQTIVDILFHLLDGTIYPTPPLGQDMTQGQFF